MNSHQRRKFKRRWKYQIATSPHDYRYIIEEQIEWAIKNFGVHKFQLHWVRGTGYHICFDDSEKAAQFAVRWSGT